MSDTYVYPSSPKNIPENFNQVSPRYKSRVIRVFLSILLFLVLYLTVVTLAGLLVWGSAYLALGIVSHIANWITILLALGIVFISVMLFFFLIKFLFSVKKDEDATRLEIKEQDQPDLFDFVRRVCAEAKAPFPKKIFLSPSINACVFYNSSFLSMFFPARKNLEIGIGLVNSINITEFKAVLAHEFGHFSQSSTRLGSYVYRFNKMVHSLLYDNHGWDSTLQSIAGIHAILGISAHITVGIARGIQQFFIKLYDFINIAYLALSREMEFHADIVSVSVAGSNAIISSLHRIEFSQAVFENMAQEVVNYHKTEKKLPANIFPVHSSCLVYAAAENDLKLEEDLPVINWNIINNRAIPDRLNLNDPWMSHPPLKERDANAHKIVLEAENCTQSPWILFRNKDEIQKKLSLKLYEETLQIKEPVLIPEKDITDHILKTRQQQKLNPAYYELYNFVPHIEFKPEDALVNFPIAVATHKELFNKGITDRVKKHYKNLAEIETIKNINDGKLKIKKFEFDGKSYRSEDTPIIYGQMKHETEEDEKWLKAHVQKIFVFFCRNMQPDQASVYTTLCDFRRKMNVDVTHVRGLYTQLIEFYIRIQQGEYNNYELTSILSLINSYYDNFINIRSKSEDLRIPSALHESGFSENYKKEFWGDVVRNPSIGSQQSAQGLIILIEDFQKLLEHIAKKDELVTRKILQLQDEYLQSLVLISPKNGVHLS